MARRGVVIPLFLVVLFVPEPVLAQMPPGGSGTRMQPAFGNGGPRMEFHPAPGEPMPISNNPGYGQPGYGQESGLTGAPPVTLTDDGTPNGFADVSAPGINHGYYFGAGATALRREGDKRNIVIDTGTPGFGGVSFDRQRISQALAWGPTLTFGYQYGPDSVELTGTYLPGTATVSNFGSTGFFDITSDLYSAEANYRWATGHGWEWVLGVRYLQVDENLFTRTPSTLGTAFLMPASVISKTQNRILAPSFGVEGEWYLYHWLAFGWSAKGSWGVNWNNVQVDYGPVVPNGFVQRRGTDTDFSHFYELNAFFDLLFTERIRLRAGYQVLWIANVPTPIGQLDPVLPGLAGFAPDANDDLFFHGPTVMLHIAF